MNRLFFWFIVLAMVAGVGVGYACHELAPDEATAKEIAGYFNIVTNQIFLPLIKMIIAPLVFSTLVSGVAHMEDAASVGRIGLKSILWFICASIVSLLVGLVMVHLLQPGAGLALPNPAQASAAASGLDASHFTLKDFVAHIFPSSIVDAMAKNEILQIVVFSLFVGTAVATLDDKAPELLKLVDQIASVMLRVTSFVMKFAPVAIFAAMAATVTTEGAGILVTYAKFVGGFYLSLAILWAILLLAALVFAGPRAVKLFGVVKEPVLLAFSTASSEAAYPKTLELVQKFGVSRRIVSFVLPLGYSFNLDGSMMYCTFATLFIAQAYGIHMALGQQITMLLLLMITSKGIAGVPRASLVVIAATLTYFRLPEAGLGLILAVDHLLDMGRSATNVIGNSVASTVVAKWEGEFHPEAAEAEARPAS